ncbi:hypothetical protein [Humisphaera borealis]|uniref:Uncharacterized protein n=1 Tax=Humisphaera borealis TaxID=2807512 RepID=A0A7M2WVI5_9BACT|nr:hypothetical protein [Humisphaera borealis]QOV88490.1 hypothetical protein IPV69_19895 [Humisphaera borealis]
MKRSWVRFTVSFVAVALLAGGIYGGILWARYPSAPDPASGTMTEAISYMATEQFGKLTKSHRKQYTIAIAERMRTIPFKDVVNLMMTDQAGKKAAAANLKDLSKEDMQEIGGHFMQVFLDGFYTQTGTERQGYLMMFALAEKAARSAASTQPSGQAATQPAGGRKKFDENHLPTPDQLEKEMAKLLQTQPPKTVAQMSQLFLDMRRTRETLGMK